MTDVLLTGFAPFDSAESNPSWDIVSDIRARWTGPETLQVAQLPVSFASAAPALESLIAAHRPSLVIATGVAAGRATITPERVAINVIDARIPDNDGAAPTSDAVVPSGPVAYWSTLPIKAMTKAMNEVATLAAVSNTAGTYVCNALFYALQHATAGTTIRSGFIHVPASEEFAAPDMPSLPRGVQVAAIEKAIRAALDSDHDISLATGAEH